MTLTSLYALTFITAAVFVLIVSAILYFILNKRLPHHTRNARVWRLFAFGIGLILADITCLGIIQGTGVNILTALIGTLGIALMLYGLGFESMLDTMRGYFNRRK